MIRFLTFSQFHGKRPPTGSTFIRVNQLIKYWDEADLYKYGEHPEALIFQKVYCNTDYKFPIHYDGIRILDICDPDWLDGAPIKETIDGMDAVTCSSQELADFIKQLTDKPVIHIPDRFDLEVIPKIKPHTEKAKTVLWFGYRHNISTLKQALPEINRLGLDLLIISDDNPLVEQYLPEMKGRVTYKKYIEETFYKLAQTTDFAVFGANNNPKYKYKSNNKTVKSILAGLPVATNTEELIAFVDPKPRQDYMDKHYDTIRQEYDVRKSVEQYKELINNILLKK